MPAGIIVMKWNERVGLETLATYPEDFDLKVSQKTLLQMYNMHQYSSGDPGTTGLTGDDINFVSYYSGTITNYFILLVLNLLEDPEDFEKKLEQISPMIVSITEEDHLEEVLPSMMLKLSGKG